MFCPPRAAKKLDELMDYKDYSIQLLQCCIFYPIANDADHGVKMQENLVFLFLLPFVIHLSGFDIDLIWTGHFELRNSFKELN